ncbi:MPN domain-containing protein, putative [Ixodes scapularis]|uniref:MPN domain-containing protein, putative n=1 Tax=Ixodes scapularis TaxID=6945 RepID=B7PU75_IXOSC|nr:MPN domain-containing protein, putative [Ixodes scapularis]|eukprot:XP_002405603.1 MPN domain-containing protein, putative [Ixodes scapularis]
MRIYRNGFDDLEDMFAAPVTRAAKGQEPDQNAAADDSGAAREAVRSPKKSSGVKAKAQADVEAEDIIVLKEAEAIETLKNKFPDSEIVSIDKSADEEDDIDIDVDTDCDTRGFDDDDDRSALLNVDVKGGGVTVEHNSGGGVISQTLVRSRAKIPKPKQNPFKLIPCRTYDDNQEPFGIHVCVSALLQMDIHSHLLETEVIGLLGGYYDEHRSCLVVSAAEPCDSVSTGLECEMDSVSQTLSMECLMGKGYDVVGWYHSHPTFVPNPSVRDVTTQRDYQAMFSGQGRPFVAAILSPYLPLNAAAPQATIAKSLVTKAKWWVVGDGHHGASVNASSSGSSVPYGFSPKLLKTDTSCIVEVRRRIDDLVKRISGNPARVGLSKAYPWLPPLHYLDKMLTSLQFHLTNSETSVEDAAEILQAVHAAFTER